jgi:hypothetical protein
MQIISTKHQFIRYKKFMSSPFGALLDSRWSVLALLSFVGCEETSFPLYWLQPTTFEHADIAFLFDPTKSKQYQACKWIGYGRIMILLYSYLL